MASLINYVLRGEKDVPSERDVRSVAQLSETLSHKQDFSRHLSALKSRVSLESEDLVAEAVRFADSHQEAFHDFIYKGDLKQPMTKRFTRPRRVQNIIAMTFVLGFLLTAIVVVGTS
jgi:hypothetical protein